MNITEKLKFILGSDYIRTDAKNSSNFKFNNSIGLNFYTYSTTINKIIIDAELDTKKTNMEIEYNYEKNQVSISIVAPSTERRWYKTHLYSIESSMCNTEELYFQESTVRDLKPFTVEDYQLLDQIYQKFHRIVRYGK